MSDLETQAFWPELLHMKDEVPLAELARRYHTTPGAISAAFERSGALREPAQAADDLLPPEPGEEAGEEGEDVLPEVRRALQTLRPGSKDMLIAAHAALLGQVPDADVARSAGVSIRTIASFRARHEIPGYRGPRRKPEPVGQRRSRIDPYAHLLGKVTDEVIAEKAGVSVHAVRSFRTRSGIPTATGERAVATVEGHHAWKVSWRSGVGRRHAVILADDLEDAIDRTQRAGLGEVIAVELLGPVVST